jgi:putative phosphoribosyl transferase
MRTKIEMRSLSVQVADSLQLEGNLYVPHDPKAMVIFSHGSGSSRFSPRNAFVAERLGKEKIASLLIDLLTPEEDATYENRFDIKLLTERLIEVTAFMSNVPETRDLPLGYFGASTGAASALRAAAIERELILAVVSRGGRPDLAMDSLSQVTAPVLLIVGGLDTEVISLNRKAYNALHSRKEFQIVDGASHLFEEPGKLEEVAKLSADWFSDHLISDENVSHNKGDFHAKGAK